MTDTASFQPLWVSPPGETIEDLLEENGWSQSELAQRIEFTAKHVNDLIKGRSAITAESAARLSRVLGSTPQFWLNREAQYRTALERERLRNHARGETDWLKQLPLAWMKKHGWVDSYHDKGDQVLELLRFFGVASVGAWQERYAKPLTAFRASPKVQKKIGAVAAWLRQGEKEAASLECAPFDKEGFKQALTEIRALTVIAEPKRFVPELVRLCARNGVAVVVVPAPTGCPASGATKWLTPTKAILQLSLRYKTNDHLWFTFFHEAAHLLLKKLLFIEGIDGLDTENEAQADRFAGNLLIPPEDARRLRKLAAAGPISKAKVRRFAKDLGIAPGIVVGRMQKEGWLPWTRMNGLKTRYELGDKL